MGNRKSVAGYELGYSGLTGLHINNYAIEEGCVTYRKVSNLMPSPCMTSAGKGSSHIKPIEKTTRSNRMKFRLIETGLLTVKNNVNAFHGNERIYTIQSRYNSSAKQDAKHKLMFSYPDFRCYFKSHPFSPVILGSQKKKKKCLYLPYIHSYT